jgi:hypothetical protein
MSVLCQMGLGFAVTNYETYIEIPLNLGAIDSISLPLHLSDFFCKKPFELLIGFVSAFSILKSL